MDMRFAQMQNLKLGRSECVERLTTIRGDRGSRLVKGQCIGAGVYVLPSDSHLRYELVSRAAGRCRGAGGVLCAAG